jgi:hypothetical protein
MWSYLDIDMVDHLKAILAAWCEITGQEVKYRPVERLLWEFHQMDFTADDLRCVVQGMKRHNSKSDSKYKIQLHKVIGDLETFASMLAEFRAKERNRPKPPSPAQRVVSEFRRSPGQVQDKDCLSLKDVFKRMAE